MFIVLFCVAFAEKVSTVVAFFCNVNIPAQTPSGATVLIILFTILVTSQAV